MVTVTFREATHTHTGELGRLEKGLTPEPRPSCGPYRPPVGVVRNAHQPVVVVRKKPINPGNQNCPNPL